MHFFGVICNVISVKLGEQSPSLLVGKSTNQTSQFSAIKSLFLG